MQKEDICLICWETYLASEMQELDQCQHKFCVNCLKKQFQELISCELIDLEYYKCPICLTTLTETLLCSLLDGSQKEKRNGLIEKKHQADYARKQNIRYYLKNKKLLNLCRCPWCELISFRESGCNFIRCQSLECQGKFVYCGQCDNELSDEDHHIHYENNNAFTGKCRIKRDGQWVDRSNIFY